VERLSGVGVLDKAVSILDALEDGPLALTGLVEATGLSRATAHRLAAALEVHRLVARDDAGRFRLGPRVAGARLADVARPALERLREEQRETITQ
jgi:DNA-binding IclR family transcriptional regulator